MTVPPILRAVRVGQAVTVEAADRATGDRHEAGRATVEVTAETAAGNLAEVLVVVLVETVAPVMAAGRLDATVVAGRLGGPAGPTAQVIDRTVVGATAPDVMIASSKTRGRR